MTGIENMKFKLIDEQKREVLEEGRDYGMGFAFAKKDGLNIITQYPISPCRDYLNDQVYSEHTGKDFRAYGLKSKYKGFLDKENGVAYLVISICKMGCKAQMTYPHYHEEVKLLDKNFHVLEKFIHWFEKKLKLPQFTKIHKLEDNKFLVIAPIFWTQYTYTISLYSLLLRMGMFYEDKNIDPINFLDKLKRGEDIYLWKDAKSKLLSMMNGCIPVQDWNKKYKCSWHNLGIIGFPFK